VLVNGSNALVVALHTSSSNPTATHTYKLYNKGYNFLDSTAAAPEVTEPFIIYPFHYIVLAAVVVAIALVCFVIQLLPFLHILPTFDVIFQTKIIPPIPFVIAESLNEITGMSFGELFVIFCYFVLTAVWLVVSTFNGK
jgi:hypothetical protein